MSGQAIPTTWGGINFRSRLEARWAAYFTRIGWEWAYEPIDAGGWIPDFILRFHKPLAVEIKPALTIEELDEHKERIDGSSWTREAVILGAVIDLEPTTRTAGIIRDTHFTSEPHWGPATHADCNLCGQPTIIAAEASFHCRACGQSDGDAHLHAPPTPIEDHWNSAGNDTQWNPARIRAPRRHMPRRRIPRARPL